MSMTDHIPPPEALKAQAKRLRSGLEAQGDFISHAEALELLATQFGYRNWNTLRAAAAARPEQPEPARPEARDPFTIGGRVAGEYLGQAFTGEILAARRLGGGAQYALTIAFDAPVDVVRFDSFSALRRRIDCLVNRQGVSWQKTSDGVPHVSLRAL